MMARISTVVVTGPREKAEALLIQPQAEAQDEFLLRDAWETSFALGFNFGNCILSRLCHATVIEIGCNNESSAPCACMAVNENALAHLVEPIHILADHEHFSVVRAGQIFPKPIESCYSVRLKSLRVIRETNFIIDSICAERVLARFL